MFTLAHTDPTGQALDRKAADLAALRSDAHAGAALLSQLEDKWFAQGRAHFLAGDDITVCWNEHQVAGYRFAAGLAADAIPVADWPQVRQRVMAEVAQLRTRHWGGEAA